MDEENTVSISDKERKEIEQDILDHADGILDEAKERERVYANDLCYELLDTVIKTAQDVRQEIFGLFDMPLNSKRGATLIFELAAVNKKMGKMLADLRDRD